MSKIWPLPKVSFSSLSAVEEKRPVAVLTSESVWQQVGASLKLPIVVQAEPATEDLELITYLSDNLPSQVKAIYAVGTGTVVTAGKMVAAAHQVPLVIVPHALDSDALFESHVLLLKDGLVTREMPGTATEVIIDWEVIQAAPRSIRGAAIVDVLAIVTALLDWRYAVKHDKVGPHEKFSPWAAGIAAGLASQAIKSAKAIGDGEPEALRTLLDLVMMSVQLAHQIGHDRHQEGFEHYFAYSLQNEGVRVPHAEAVGPGIIMASMLHNQSPTALQEALINAGIQLDQLRPADVQLAINDLPNFCATNDLPFGIAHEFDPFSDAVNKALGQLGLRVEESDTGSWQPATVVEPAPTTDTAQNQATFQTTPGSGDTIAAPSSGGYQSMPPIDLDDPSLTPSPDESSTFLDGGGQS